MAHRKTPTYKPTTADLVGDETWCGPRCHRTSATAKPRGSFSRYSSDLKDLELVMNGDFTITPREIDAIERMLGVDLMELLKLIAPKVLPQDPADDDTRK